MKTTTLTLTEQELNDLREFYTMQLARAKREVAHYENILSKLEKGQKSVEQTAETEVPSAPVKVKGKRGRPRKEAPIAEKPVATPVAETPVAEAIEEAKPKGKKGRPRKMKQAPELLSPEEMPMAKKARKAKETQQIHETPVDEGSEPAAEKPKARRGHAANTTEKIAPKAKAKKTKATRTNSRGRKTVTSELDIPYTDFILATLSKATMALGAKDLIAIMKEEYKLEDKVLLKKADASLRSSLSGLKKKGKISFFKNDEGLDKYYLAQPTENEAGETPSGDNPSAEA